MSSAGGRRRSLLANAIESIGTTPAPTSVAEVADAEALVSLLTPVIKGYGTDKGFDVTVNCQQVYGGHGYVKEWGMEQFVRDARIAQIYEGTNGVQAMDLVGRKLALVDDQPGVTRDLREGDAKLFDLRFTVIDTAGLEEVTDDAHAVHERSLDDLEGLAAGGVHGPAACRGRARETVLP